MKSITNRKTRKRTIHGRAQAMVEFMLVLPILLLIMVGLLEFGRLLFAWLIVENSTRFGIRYATAGTYNPAYCPGATAEAADGTADCAGLSENQEVEFARRFSIEDETKGIILGFHYEEAPVLTAADNDYLNITVCSRDNFIIPHMGRPDYAGCTGGENAGMPGDTVHVATDYNFTFIMLPIFGVQPDGIHLASYRSGVNELFRVASLVNPGYNPNPGPAAAAPVECGFLGCTDTPTSTNTSTPTDTVTPSTTPTITFTPTVTLTPTITNTPLPIVIQWVSPSVNGQVITDPVETDFRAIAYDPARGTSDGNGISRVNFWSVVPGATRQENFAAYCVFGGNLPCTTMTSSSFYALTPGTYTLYAQATANDGRTSDVIEIDFVIPNLGTPTYTPSRTPTSTRTNTLTPTVTRTPTITLTPSRTLTPSLTYTPSRTPTRTNTPLPTYTPTISRTPTTTNTRTNTPTRTDTPTRTNTPPNTATRTATATAPTPTRTLIPTNTSTCSDC